MGTMASRIFTRFRTATFLGAAAFAAPSFAFNHCQVPCGIFNDKRRIQGLLEDCSTIKKASGQVQGLAGKSDAQSLNQATRWIMTREDHAKNVIKVVSEYFLTQKMKEIPPASDTVHYQEYLAKLAAHHAVMVAAMKAKQTSDEKAAEVLLEKINELAKLYGA